MKRGILALGLAGWAACAANAQPDYPSAIWNPAYSGNYTVANRPSSNPIQYVVVHITEGSYSGAISWFKNPASKVSAHYVIRSSDGQVTQMVQEKDIGWHAGVWWYNQRSVGIEHEATSTSPSWYTDSLYRSSASLTRYLTSKYSIPRTRDYIIGHKETGASTSCPGPYWDFAKYMALVLNNAAYDSASIPIFLNPGQQVEVIVRFVNNGGDVWPSTGADRVLLGTASPSDRSSPFYTSGSWISTSRAAAVAANTPVGSIGEFRFRMTGPATHGTYNEAFQLTRSSIGWFGPVVSFAIDVGKVDRVIDNTSPNFTAFGSWSSGTTAAGKYGDDYRWRQVVQKTADHALWALDAPVSGLYDLYAWWSAGSNRNPRVLYEAETARDGKLIKFFDQTINGGQWNYIGRVRIPQGGGSVRMYASGRGGGVCIADAVRMVGPF